MGCDIHDYIEVKKPGHKNWELAYDGSISGRDYLLFGILAGVRTTPPKLPNGLLLAQWWAKGIKVPSLYGKPRGLPKDISKVVRDSQWYDGSYHSDSYGNIDDVKFWTHLDEYHKVKIEEEYPLGRVGPERMKSLLRPVLKMMEKLEAKGCESRFIFWFDS